MTLDPEMRAICKARAHELAAAAPPLSAEARREVAEIVASAREVMARLAEK